MVKPHSNGNLHHPLDDEKFVKRCYAHACDTTEGYKDWVYHIYILSVPVK